MFRIAASFLTILPLRPKGEPAPGDLGRAATWFPLVGCLVGAILAGAGILLERVFPPMISAILLVALWAFLTGGLHLDGLADCCDGFMASASPARRLEIMADPRLGTFGGAGLALFLLLKVAALLSMPLATAILPLVLAASLGRAMLLWVARQPQARPGGLGAEFAGGLNTPRLLAAMVIPLVLAALGGERGLVALGVAALLTGLVILLARARLGGVTGDVLGLTVELVELGVLLTYAARLPFIISL